MIAPLQRIHRSYDSTRYGSSFQRPLFRLLTGLLLGLWTLSSGPLAAQIHRVTDQVRLADLKRLANHEEMVMVPMRDGVGLATEIYTPKGEPGPFPVVFWRTPYNFSALQGSNPNRPNARLKFALDAIEQGYAFVVQNERGQFFSEGEWQILGNPRTDGYDALTWLARQSWSTGKVATLGCSSTAEWQMGLAAMNHPAHAAAVPMGQGAGIGRVGPFYEQGNFFRGGAIQMPMAVWLYGVQNTQRPQLSEDLSRADRIRLSRYFDLAARMPSVNWPQALKTLPVKDLMEAVEGPKGVFGEFAQRSPDDEAWYEGGLYHDNESFGVPALWVNSWYDLSVGPNLALYGHVSREGDEDVRDHQYMVVSPTLHCAQYRLPDGPLIVGERELAATGPEADFGLDEMLWSFLDRYTRDADNEFEQRFARVQYYSMGDNQWRDAEAWPPREVKELSLYLASDKGANSLFGDGALVAEAPGSGLERDLFVYDPTIPVPTKGGNFCCLGGEPEGAFDQRSVEARQDVLVFSTEPLEEPLEVAGWIRVNLFVSSNAKDTDFTVKLVDVHPDGRAFNLDDSILRARYRDGFDQKIWMEEGSVYELEIGPLSTANVFEKGHRIRLEVSSSNFPRYERNLNTGGNNFDETEFVRALNGVHHSETYPSRLILPVVQRP